MAKITHEQICNACKCFYLFLGTFASLTEAVWVAVIAAAPAKKAAMGQENLQSSEPAVAETEGQGETNRIALLSL